MKFNEKERQLTWVTEASIIATIPVIAYLWTFFYEKGIYDYFSIPYYFISLSPTLVLATTYLISWYLGYLFVTIVLSLVTGAFVSTKPLYSLLAAVFLSLFFQ